MDSLSPLQIAYCGVVLLVSYSLRGSTGFGQAVGLPLLALVLPVKVLAPAWNLLGIISSIAILGPDRRHVARREFALFLPWCLAGVGIGLYFFKTLDPKVLSQTLGAVVLVYAAYSFLLSVRPLMADAAPAWLVRPLVSVLSGAVGTLFGTMATIFFAMYLNAGGMGKSAFRATISAMLLTLCIVREIGYAAVGEVTFESWIVFAAMCPATLLGIYLGNRLHSRLSDLAFKRLVIATLVLSGIPLILKS